MTRATFDTARFSALRRERGFGLGSPLRALAETASTNDDAMREARAGGTAGTVFVADAQTAGRGRRGHTWTSPPGENLLLSVLLRPALPPGRASGLTLAAGLAVRDAAAELVTTQVLVKWPNDIVAGDRKLAGILVESQVASDRLSAVVVGIGLNVSMRDLPVEIRDIATSLGILGARCDRETALVSVLSNLERRMQQYEDSGLADMLKELRAHDALRDRQVTIEGVRGVARGIAEDGALLIELPSGSVERVMSGEVSSAPDP